MEWQIHAPARWHNEEAWIRHGTSLKQACTSMGHNSVACRLFSRPNWDVGVLCDADGNRAAPIAKPQQLPVRQATPTRGFFAWSWLWRRFVSGSMDQWRVEYRTTHAIQHTVPSAADQKGVHSRAAEARTPGVVYGAGFDVDMPEGARDGTDGDLVSEVDLLEAVHDADELAALMARRRDARAMREYDDTATGTLSLQEREGASKSDDHLDMLLASPGGGAARPDRGRNSSIRQIDQCGDTSNGGDDDAGKANPSLAINEPLESPKGPAMPMFSGVGGAQASRQHKWQRGRNPTVDSGLASSTNRFARVGGQTASSLHQQTQAGIARPQISTLPGSHATSLREEDGSGSSGAVAHRSSSLHMSPQSSNMSAGDRLRATKSCPAEARGPVPAKSVAAVASGDGSNSQLSKTRKHIDHVHTEHSGRCCCRLGCAVSSQTSRSLPCTRQSPRKLLASPKSQQILQEREEDEIRSKLGICTAPSLRRIVLRAAVVLTALLGLMGATTYVFSASSQESASKAANINNAGRRRALTTQTLNLLQELILDDGQVDTHENLVTSVEDTLQFFERVHDGLRYGDKELGLGGEGTATELVELSRLYYGTAGAGFELTSTDTLGITDFSSIGLDPLLRHFWSTSRRVLELYRNTSTPRPERNLSGLLGIKQFRALWEMQATSLSEKLGMAVRIYTTADVSIIDGLEVEAYVVLSVEMLVLGLAYLVVYEGISAAVVSEHLRTRDVRVLIPRLIRLRTPSLVAAFEAVEGTRSSRVLVSKQQLG